MPRVHLLVHWAMMVGGGWWLEMAGRLGGCAAGDWRWMMGGQRLEMAVAGDGCGKWVRSIQMAGSWQLAMAGNSWRWLEMAAGDGWLELEMAGKAGNGWSW
eukprot:s381_g14.t1